MIGRDAAHAAASRRPRRTSAQDRDLRGLRPRVPRSDGWTAALLGTVARAYLVFAGALALVALAPALLGWSGSVVQSGSMRPAIEAGDVVLSSPLPADDPVPLGGVVQFRGEAPDGTERLVVHRIVAPGDAPGEWVTQGDANADPDSVALRRDDITGQGRLLVQWVGLPGWWLRTGQPVPFTVWALATAAAVGLAIWSGQGRRRDDEPSDDAAADDAPAEPHEVAPGRTTRRLPALAGASVSAVALVVTLVATGTAPPADAAFTARTSSVRNTFQVAHWPTLTLGRSTSFAILAATRVANVEVLGIGSSVDGSVAVAPGTGYTGFWPWDVTGTVERNTPVAVNARTDATALYDAARSRSTTTAAPATLTGRVTPGVLRRAGAVTVSGTLTLDALGDPSATFVVQGTSLTFAPGARVELAGGATLDRALFVSTGTTLVSDNATVRGVLLSSGDVTLQRGTLLGRAFSLNGAVTLTRATVDQP